MSTNFLEISFIFVSHQVQLWLVSSGAGMAAAKGNAQVSECGCVPESLTCGCGKLNFICLWPTKYYCPFVFVRTVTFL